MSAASARPELGVQDRWTDDASARWYGVSSTAISSVIDAIFVLATP